MKVFILIFWLGLAGCGPNSSPEGRMTIKVEQIKQELDSLKKQNAMILDSLGKINAHLQKLETQK